MGRKLPSQVSIHFWTVSSSSSVTNDKESPSFKQGSSLWSSKGSVRGESDRADLPGRSLVSATSDNLLGSIISKSMLSSMFIRSSIMSSLSLVVDVEEEPEEKGGVMEETEFKVPAPLFEIWLSWIELLLLLLLVVVAAVNWLRGTGVWGRAIEVGRVEYAGVSITITWRWPPSADEAWWWSDGGCSCRGRCTSCSRRWPLLSAARGPPSSASRSSEDVLFITVESTAATVADTTAVVAAASSASLTLDRGLRLRFRLFRLFRAMGPPPSPSQSPLSLSGFSQAGFTTSGLGQARDGHLIWI